MPSAHACAVPWANRVRSRPSARTCHCSSAPVHRARVRPSAYAAVWGCVTVRRRKSRSPTSQVSVPVARITWPFLLIFAVGSVLPTKAGLLPISTSAPSIETNTAARFMAASLSRLNRVRQDAARTSGRDDVPLLFVEPYGAFQDAGRFVGTANKAQDLGQVDEAVR